MYIPQGYQLYRSSPHTKVCKLKKRIYGFKQVSRRWYSKLSESLLSIGYVHSTGNYSLFTKSSGPNFTALLVYVNDIILIGNNLTKIQNVKAILHTKFCIKHLGALKYFRGLEVARSSYDILLKSSQLYSRFIKHYRYACHKAFSYSLYSFFKTAFFDIHTLS